KPTFRQRRISKSSSTTRMEVFFVVMALPCPAEGKNKRRFHRLRVPVPQSFHDGSREFHGRSPNQARCPSFLLFPCEKIYRRRGLTVWVGCRDRGPGPLLEPFLPRGGRVD